MDQWLQPLTLEIGPVRLVPLEQSHRDALVAAASDGKLWEIWHTSVPSEHTIDAYLERAFADQEAGTALAFAIMHVYSDEVIGTTRYYAADAANRRLDIGYTWYAKRYQRTGVNTRCKYLLLRHAFETLDCIVVGFKTNYLNRASRKAIARIGARQDGVLRNHQITADGTLRDTVVFSIVREEWPAVSKNLDYMMSKGCYE